MNDHNFNKNHPERMDDEVFITNASDKIDRGILTIGLPPTSSYDAIGWSTKRRGKTSYNLSGEILDSKWSGSFPVFVKKTEIEKSEHASSILESFLPNQ